MAYETWDYCKFETSIPDSTKEFLDDAFFQVNFFRWAIEEYFNRKGSSGTSFIKHINGSTKVKIKVKRLSGAFTGVLGHAWPDGAGTGTIVLNSVYVNCCRNIYNGTQGDYDMANRYGALLEVASVIIHEMNHVVWKLGEKQAWSMEGFFRHKVQGWLGIADADLCGQETWPCGVKTKRSQGCGLSDLQRNMVDIQDNPDRQCLT